MYRGGEILIYFDNAATTKIKPKCVIDAVVNAMNTAGNSSRGGTDESLSSDRIVFEAREGICNLFNGENARQIAFTKNSTEALNIAIMGIIEPKDHVITTVTEHNSVIRPLNYLKERGVEVDYIGIDENANLNIDKIGGLIKENTKAIVVNHGSNVTGNIVDIGVIGEISRENNIILIVDASQSAGSINIDVEDMKIDVLCFTGHKSLLGPQGTGGIYVSKNIDVKPFIVGGTGVQTYNEFQPNQMPIKLEAGTLNAHGLAGLAAGVNYICEEGIEKLHEKAISLSKIFYEGIKEIDGIKFYGDYDFKKTRSPIVAFNLGNKDSSEVSYILSSKYGISTRPGGHCAPLLHKAMGTVEQGIVRFSFSHTNTVEEVEVAIKAVKEISKFIF